MSWHIYLLLKLFKIAFSLKSFFIAQKTEAYFNSCYCTSLHISTNKSIKIYPKQFQNYACAILAVTVNIKLKIKILKTNNIHFKRVTVIRIILLSNNIQDTNFSQYC